MFFKTYLKIADVKTPFINDRFEFLKKIFKAYVLRFPFQNVLQFGRYPIHDRKVADIRAMFSSNFSGVGGLCGHLNVFMKYELEAIGFDTTLVTGTFVRTKVPNSHCIFTLKIPAYSCRSHTKDRTYLMDLGCGIPLHEPICLEELPYRSRAGGYDFYYHMKSDGIVERVHEDGDCILGPLYKNQVCPQNYLIELAPKQYSQMAGAIREVYSDTESTFLHHGLYLFRYLSIDEDGKDFKCICIRGTEVVFITRETREVHSYDDYSQVRPYVIKYFPMLQPVDVDIAIANFTETTKALKNRKKKK